MSAWIALFKKECRLGSIGFFIALILLITVLAFGFYNRYRYGAPETLLVVGVVVVFFHAFYLLGYMIISLVSERKTLHLWLHHPLPASVLLGTKLMGGMIAMLISLVVTCLYVLYGAFSQFDFLHEFGLQASAAFQIGFILVIHIILIAIYIAIVFTFLWVLRQALRTKIGKWSWLVLIAIFYFVPWIIHRLEQTGLFTTLTHWGAISTDFLTFLYPLSNIGTQTVYIGFYVFHLAIAAILFALSSWLLDNKVEVS